MPASFPAGTTVSYRRSYGDFPASAWDLDLLLGGPGTPRSFDGTADGDEFLVAIAPAVTSPIDPGWHEWVERVTHKTDGRVFDAARGRVLVRLDLATASGEDSLSFYERLLPVLERFIMTSSKRGLEAFSMGGVSMQKLDIEKAVRLRATAIAAINSRRAGGPVVGEVLVRFTPIGETE